jgi:hypothetical protein
LCTQAKYEALAAADKERFAAEVAALNNSETSDSSSAKSTAKKARKPASSKASSSSSSSSSDSSSSSSSSSDSSSSAAASVKNPRNAYILYGSAKRDSVKAELAAAAAAASSSDSSSAAAIGSNASIMKEIARLWREASPDEKVCSALHTIIASFCIHLVSILLC